MPRQSILVHSYILISSSFSRSWWPLGVGGGQEEDEQPSLPCVKPTEPSRRSDWHITCVAWLQAHRRQEQKWHPWSSYLLDTSVWKMWSSFLTMSPHLTGLESLKAWHSNWAYCNVGIGKEERLFETIQEETIPILMLLPILECIVWHLVEVLQIVCSLVEVVEESLQILCYIVNSLWIMFSCLSCRSFLGLCAISTTPLHNRLPTEPRRTRQNTASFPFSLSFFLLSRMSWSELSGLLKRGSPASPQKEKKQKKKKTKRRTFRKVLLLLNFPWDVVEGNLSDPFCQWARTHSYICPGVLNLLRSFRVSCRWEERQSPPRSSLALLNLLPPRFSHCCLCCFQAPS